MAASTAPVFGGVTDHMTFAFSDLVGTYTQGPNPGFGNLTVIAGAGSSGDITRLTGGGGTAELLPDFVTSIGADVWISMDVSVDQNGPGNIAQGIGLLEITDGDGDTIGAEIYGAFSGGGAGDYFFVGYLYNVLLATDDGYFNGSSGMADMDLPGNGPYQGIFVELYFAPGSGFFDSDFTASTQAAGIITPTPGSLALLGLGCLAGAGGAAGRNRKTRAT
ncbi:MAG: hypothetical protein EDM82_07110 [Cyanobacteria bacterium CYA]|nr:MAG: hypothetical protein EDM82_07110 [Cyanobacteria bacterium CYA]